jgi:hypothetical protein
MMGQWNASENRSSTSRDKNDFMGNNSAHNEEVKIIVDLVEARFREEGVGEKLGQAEIRMIHDHMKAYKKGIGQKNGNVPREAFPEIAEEIAGELLGSRLKNMENLVSNDNSIAGPFEKPLGLREAAASQIDAMIDRALNHKKSPISPKDPVAAKVREVLRSKFLAELDHYLSQNPEITNLRDLEMYGFFNGKMSLTVDYLGKVAKEPALLEKDSRSVAPPPGKTTFELSRLHSQKQKDVTEWLGDRELSSLTVSEQKELILHLTKSKNWKRGDIQDLIGVEGMRQLLGYGTEIPFGFESVKQWKDFEKKLMQALADGGVPVHDPRVKVLLQRSSVRGQSHEAKGGGAFRWKGNVKAPEKELRRPSDFDIAVIVEPDLYDIFLARRAQSFLEKEGKVSTRETDADLRRILKEKRLASSDQDAALQSQYQVLRSLYGRRFRFHYASRVSFAGSGEVDGDPADILTGEAAP